MAKFLIEVTEGNITHDEIVELLTGEDLTDNEDYPLIDIDDLKVTRLKDNTEVPEDAVYVEDLTLEDPNFPSNATDDSDK